MKMKKHAFLALAAVAALCIAFIAYCYFTPDIRLRVSSPVDANAQSYVCKPMLALSTKLGLPLPPRTKARIMEYIERTDAVDMALYNTYARPMQIDVSVELLDGKTIITYFGSVTEKGGGSIPYEKRLVFDFILTKDIPQTPLSRREPK